MQSAQKVNGICPGINSPVYSIGVIEGFDCLKLTLVDGGSFDGDGQVNASISDPGVIAISIDQDSNDNSGTQDTNPDTSSSSDNNEKGGGIFMPIFLLFILLIWIIYLPGIRRIKNHFHR